MFAVLQYNLLHVFFTQAECWLLPPSLLVLVDHEFKCLLLAIQQIEFTVSHLFERFALKSASAEVFHFLHIEIEAFLQKRKDLVLLYVCFNVILYLSFQFANVQTMHDVKDLESMSSANFQLKTIKARQDTLD